MQLFSYWFCWCITSNICFCSKYLFDIKYPFYWLFGMSFVNIPQKICGYVLLSIFEADVIHQELQGSNWRKLQYVNSYMHQWALYFYSLDTSDNKDVIILSRNKYRLHPFLDTNFLYDWQFSSIRRRLVSRLINFPISHLDQR